MKMKEEKQANGKSNHDYQCSLMGYSKSSRGVWYYEIQVIHFNEPDKTFVIRRRYTDFEKLHQTLKHFFPEDNIPSLPRRIDLWSILLGINSNILLARAYKFNKLLKWIHKKDGAKDLSCYANFIGLPPDSKTHSGYVSLCKYKSQDWLKSLEEVVRSCREKGEKLSVSNEISSKINSFPSFPSTWLHKTNDSIKSTRNSPSMYRHLYYKENCTFNVRNSFPSSYCPKKIGHNEIARCV